MSSRGTRVVDELSHSVEPEGWCVYLLRCRDGSLYAGATNRLVFRVQQHNTGRGAAYTRSRGPVTLVWFELTETRSAALSREAAIKRLTRREKLALVVTGLLGRRSAWAPTSAKSGGG